MLYTSVYIRYADVQVGWRDVPMTGRHSSPPASPPPAVGRSKAPSFSWPGVEGPGRPRAVTEAPRQRHLSVPDVRRSTSKSSARHESKTSEARSRCRKGSKEQVRHGRASERGTETSSSESPSEVESVSSFQTERYLDLLHHRLTTPSDTY